jgi:hypothetical protein
MLEYGQRKPGLDVGDGVDGQLAVDADVADVVMLGDRYAHDV